MAIFCFVFCQSIHSQLQIDSLNHFFTLDSSRVFVKDVFVEFTCSDVDEVEMIYLTVGSEDENPPVFKLFETAFPEDGIYTLRPRKWSDRFLVKIELPAKHFSKIGHIRIYISDKNYKYSNTLIYDPAQ